MTTSTRVGVVCVSTVRTEVRECPGRRPETAPVRGPEGCELASNQSPPSSSGSRTRCTGRRTGQYAEPQRHPGVETVATAVLRREWTWSLPSNGAPITACSIAPLLASRRPSANRSTWWERCTGTRDLVAVDGGLVHESTTRSLGGAPARVRADGASCACTSGPGRLPSRVASWSIHAIGPSGRSSGCRQRRLGRRRPSVWTRTSDSSARARRRSIVDRPPLRLMMPNAAEQPVGDEICQRQCRRRTALVSVFAESQPSSSADSACGVEPP